MKDNIELKKRVSKRIEPSRLGSFISMTTFNRNMDIYHGEMADGRLFSIAIISISCTANDNETEPVKHACGQVIVNNTPVEVFACDSNERPKPNHHQRRISVYTDIDDPDILVLYSEKYGVELCRVNMSKAGGRR